MKRILFFSFFAVLASALIANAQSSKPEQQAAKTAADVLSRVTRLKGLKLASKLSSQPPTSSDCLNQFGVPCYSPQNVRDAYGLTPLLNAGYMGSGETIVIIDSFGSPTIEQDLKTFDAGFGLPDPPSLTVLSPLGTVPFDPTDSTQVGWAGETTLDVEWAHAIAPGASIVLLTSPVDENEGVAGMPEFLKLEEYALDHHLGRIISQSWGTTENTLFNSAGLQVINNFEHFYAQAANEDITVLASSGDTGSANVDVNGNFYSFPTVLFPASSPYVTAVGGASLYLDSRGSYQSETVWNNATGASGGGISQYFGEPLYQAFLPFSVQKKLRGYRGIPDVAYNADPNTPILVYMGFFPNAGDNGYYLIGGTSAAAPQWAGIVADANQLAGHPLGFLNPKLYLIGAAQKQCEFFHDITSGNNSFNSVPGYNATAGWDFASGWGTPNLGELLWELGRDR